LKIKSYGIWATILGDYLASIQPLKGFVLLQSQPYKSPLNLELSNKATRNKKKKKKERREEVPNPT